MELLLQDRVIAQALSVILFRGRAIHLEEIRGINASTPEGWRQIESMADDGRIELDRFGKRIYGALGITLVSTPHEIDFGSVHLYARSPHLALELFRELEESASLRTPCPACSRPLNFRVRGGTILRARPRRHKSICFVTFLLAVRDRERAEFPASVKRLYSESAAVNVNPAR